MESSIGFVAPLLSPAEAVALSACSTALDRALRATGCPLDLSAFSRDGAGVPLPWAIERVLGFVARQPPLWRLTGALRFELSDDGADAALEALLERCVAGGGRCAVESVLLGGSSALARLPAPALLASAGLNVCRMLSLSNAAQFADSRGLGALHGLRRLRLDGSRVGDLAPLAALADLEELWCERTDVGDVAPLAALQKLHTLLLNRTRVVDLSPLAQCCALEVINVHATRVRSVAVLAPCARLSRVMALACAELSDEDVEALRTRTASSALRVRHSRG